MFTKVFTKVRVCSQRYAYVHKGPRMFTKVRVCSQRSAYVHKGTCIDQAMCMYTTSLFNRMIDITTNM